MRWNAFKSTLSTQINVYQTLFYNQQHSDVIKVVEAKERKKRSVEPSARFRWERKNGNWKWCDGIVFGMEKFSQASVYLHTITNYIQFAEWLFNWKKGHGCENSSHFVWCMLCWEKIEMAVISVTIFISVLVFIVICNSIVGLPPICIWAYSISCLLLGKKVFHLWFLHLFFSLLLCYRISG